MRAHIAVLLALSTVSPARSEYVPPVPRAIAGSARLGDNAIPLPDPAQKWIRAVSPNFTVISSAPAARTREISELLETVAGALRRVHPRFDARFTDTTVFVFSRRRDSQPYFELLLNQKRTGASGAFVTGPDGMSAMIVDATRTLVTDRTVKHELMHNILSASGTRLPLWLEEGIAEYFSTTEIRGNRVIVGRPILQHQTHLRIRGVLPMETVMAAKSGDPITAHVLFYPQVWAMVDWMMRASRGEFYAFVSDVEGGMDAAAAFRSRFALDPAAVARALRTVMLRPSASSALQIDRKPVEVSVEEIRRADALCELAGFLGRMNRSRDDAEKHLRAALDLDGHHARATAGLGTLRAFDRRFADAESHFEEALKLDGDDPAVKLAYASALLRNAIGPFAGTVDLDDGAAARFRRARQLAIAALEKEPSALAEAIAGTSYLVDEDVAAGIAHLERAHTARPGRIDYALNLYALYLRAHRDDLADALFAASFERSRNPQAVFAARTIYVRESFIRANRLIRQERLADAAAIVQRVADATPDEAARRELLQQAERLRSVAESNRDITEYNKAVAAYNERRHAEALRILETLVATATDGEVRGRAERLRVAVRKRLEGM